MAEVGETAGASEPGQSAAAAPESVAGLANSPSRSRAGQAQAVRPHPDFDAFVAAAMAGAAARKSRRLGRTVALVLAAIVVLGGAIGGVVLSLHRSPGPAVAPAGTAADTTTIPPDQQFDPAAGWVAHVADDGAFQLWTSPAWSVWDRTDAALALRDQADFQFVKVFAEPRSDYDDLDAYLASVRAAHADDRDRHSSNDTAPTAVTVDNQPARQWQVTEEYHGLSHVAWYTLVQGKRGFYEILAYTRDSTVGANREGLQQITRSFHEIPGAPAPRPVPPEPPQPPRAFVAPDGKAQLTAPQNWSMIPAGRMDSGAVLGIEDGAAQVMVFVSDRRPGEDLAAAVRGVQTNVSQDPNFHLTQISAQTLGVIGGMAATQWHTTGAFRGHNLTTWYAMLAGSGNYYEVMAWTPVSRTDAEGALVASVLSSFRLN